MFSGPNSGASQASLQQCSTTRSSASSAADLRLADVSAAAAPETGFDVVAARASSTSQSATVAYLILRSVRSLVEAARPLLQEALDAEMRRAART